MANEKQKILQLMTIKYDSMCDNKKIIQGNGDFITMARVLLKEKQPTVPILGVHSIIKLQVFDKEIYVANDANLLDLANIGQKEEDKVVQLMQIVSQISMNAIFLAIGGKVYKYDLVTKQLLFEFSSQARKNMQLYDFDDKLLVSDSHHVRLWDFFNHKDEVPELVTILESPIKVDLMVVNKKAESAGERKDVFYYVIACQNEFKVFSGRLELLIQGEVDGMDKIRSIEFGLETKVLYVGTEKGHVYRYELPSPQEVEEEYEKGD